MSNNVDIQVTVENPSATVQVETAQGVFVGPPGPQGPKGDPGTSDAETFQGRSINDFILASQGFKIHHVLDVTLNPASASVHNETAGRYEYAFPDPAATVEMIPMVVVDPAVAGPKAAVYGAAAGAGEVVLLAQSPVELVAAVKVYMLALGVDG